MAKRFVPARLYTTREIDMVRSRDSGWTAAHLAALDVPWPPPKGWRNAILEQVPANRLPDIAPPRLQHVRLPPGHECTELYVSPGHADPLPHGGYTHTRRENHDRRREHAGIRRGRGVSAVREGRHRGAATADRGGDRAQRDVPEMPQVAPDHAVGVDVVAAVSKRTPPPR